MTDWRNGVSLDDEILSGNNIKMPFGYPDEAKKALDAFKSGKINLDILRENASYVLKSIIKTRSFINKDFGLKHHINKELEIPATQVNGLSSTRIRQGQICNEWYLSNLGKDQRAQRTFVYYLIDAEYEGEYSVTCTVFTNCPKGRISFINENDENLSTVNLYTDMNKNEWQDIRTNINLHKGENIVKIVFACDLQEDCEFSKCWFETTEDIRLLKIILKLHE